MKKYKYIARDSSGQRKEGLSQALSENDVLSQLRERGFTPISIDEISEGVAKTARTAHRRRVKSSDLAALCWQLTTMLEGGIPITEALSAISEDMDNLQLQKIMQQVVEKIHQGNTLSECISEFPNVFNELSCAMVLAGETSGTLSQTLHRLAEYFDNRDKMARKVKGAMIYPVFVFAFIILIVIFIMTFIIPRFRIIFDQFKGELPAFTKAFMGFYDIVRYNLVYIIGAVLLVIILAGLAYTKTQKGHILFCRMALKIPVLGKIISQAFVAVFCRTMSTLLSAGVSVLEVFDILSTMTSNDIMKGAVIQAREHIIDGSNISLGIAASGFFPNMIIRMIEVGEKSGSLPRVLDRTADYYERRVDAMITNLMTLLEPIMIITVGAIVLTVTLALYLPIFTMSEI